MKTVVISQPMYFPWVGMHEQLRLADDYVDYADVAFSKGSFINRVQIKTAVGSQWLTLPLYGLRLGQLIAEVKLDERQQWRSKHRKTLAQVYARAPFLDDLLALVDEVFASTPDNLAEVSLASTLAVHRYFDFDHPLRIHSSIAMDISGSKSQRVLDIVRALNGNRYVTGHGALNYLDHELFERADIAVEYMQYEKREYPQEHPPFTPYVSTLDLIANMGRAGRACIISGAVGWREMRKLHPATTAQPQFGDE